MKNKDKKVFYYGANLWNELPVETRRIETYNKFKMFKKTNVIIECILYYNWYHTVLLLNSIVKPCKIFDNYILYQLM